MLNLDVVVPEYFSTFGITLLRGRGFTDQDREGAPAVVVLSRVGGSALLARHGSDRQAAGDGSEIRTTATVVGIVPDTRYRDLREARPSVYFPLRQSPFPYPPLTLAIRTRGHRATWCH